MSVHGFLIPVYYFFFSTYNFVLMNAYRGCRRVWHDNGSAFFNHPFSSSPASMPNAYRERGVRRLLFQESGAVR